MKKEYIRITKAKKTFKLSLQISRESTVESNRRVFSIRVVVSIFQSQKKKKLEKLLNLNSNNYYWLYGWVLYIC